MPSEPADITTIHFDRDDVPAGRLVRPRPPAAADDDRLLGLPTQTRAILQMLAVLNSPMPMALLGQAARVDSPSAAIEPAVAAGLVDWSPDEPACPVAIRHSLVRDAIYAGITPTKRHVLHARAASMVSEPASWRHRVAALECPDEGLAARLEHLAAGEAAAGRPALAATYLRWASDVSPVRADRDRRLLTAALHLVLAEEARGLTLRESVEETAPSPLRSCVLGTMAFAAGQLVEAERWFSEALAGTRDDADSRPLAALSASRLADTYTLLGEGEKAMTLGRWALGTGCLDPAATSETRTRIAIAAAQVAGSSAGLAELEHLAADPARVDLVDADGLAFRGVFRLLTGDLDGAVADLRASLELARRGAALIQGLRAYCYLAMAQYLAGAWDDVLLTAEQGVSAAAVHSRRNELPLLQLAASAVPAGRGGADAGQHARLAEEAAASLDYGHERLYAAMARALACQAAGDYLGMADALGPWQDEAALDGRSRMYAQLWRPLLAEGLIGSGQLERAAVVLAQLRADSGQVSYLAPALAWLDGWLAEQRGALAEAQETYARGVETASTQSPVYTARLLLAHGKLLRRTGNRKDAIEQLRRAHDLYQALGAAPFLARTEEELAACHLPGRLAGKKQSVLALTSRETEVAHLVGRGLSNPEIAAELFISRKAVEYHLGNIYAKCGLQGRQQLRRFVEQQSQLAAA